MPIHEAPTPAPTDEPMFVINDSKWLAMAKTGASLLVFASTFFVAAVGFARDLDLNGFLIYIQRDDTTKGLASLIGAAYFFWRVTAAKRKKLRDIIIARSARNRVAMLKSEVKAQRHRSMVYGDVL